MLSLIMLLGVGLVQEADRKPTESEIRAAHQMLAGDWRLESVTDNGDTLGTELIRRKIARDGRIVIGNRVVTHVNPETGETRTTGYMINPARFPRELDLITPEERVLPGIYRFEGDDLVVCFSNREGRERPREFEAQSGSFRTLLRLRIGGKAAAAPAVQPNPDSSAPTEAPAPVKTRTASLTTPSRERGERRPTQSELARERDLLAGKWTIERITDDGEDLSADLVRAKIAEDGMVRIGVRGFSVISPRDDQKRLWAYRIDPSASPRHMDVTTQFDAVLKGIYAFEGDRLLFCVAKNEEDPRPTSLEAPSGSDRMLYRLRMVKEEEKPARAAAQVKTPAPTPAPLAPPSPSPEELARRREQRIREMLVGSWAMRDNKGDFVAVFRSDGSFSATRTFARKRLFEPDSNTFNGSWSYGQSYLSARVTGTTDRNMLGYGFVGRLQSIGDEAFVTADNSGKLLTFRKVR